MYDQITIKPDVLIVTSSDFLSRVKTYFLWLLIILCSCFSIIIIKNFNSPLKFLFVFLFVILVIYYKFVYLKFNANKKIRKLLVSANHIEYCSGFHTYKISLRNIVDIEDRSKYYDFQGRNERGWNHIFAIKISEACKIVCISSTKGQCSQATGTSEILVSTLLLKHKDYELVLHELRKYWDVANNH